MEYPATQKDSSKMNTVRRAGLIILLFGLGLLFWSVPAHSENAVVVRVIDGDTIRVWLDDSLQTVRLLGVDTPETKHPTKKVQKGGPEASAFTQAALDRKTVRLEADPEGDLVDRYDRLLRYVYLEGKNFNATLIREGYATAIRTFPYSRNRARPNFYSWRPRRGRSAVVCGPPQEGADKWRALENCTKKWRTSMRS